MLLSPKDGAYAAWLSAAGRLPQLADGYDGNSGPRGDQLGQVRQIGGHYQHGRGPVSCFRLFRLLYRSRGHHRVHGLPRRHVRGTDQLATVVRELVDAA